MTNPLGITSTSSSIKTSRGHSDHARRLGVAALMLGSIPLNLLIIVWTRTDSAETRSLLPYPFGCWDIALVVLCMGWPLAWRLGGVAVRWRAGRVGLVAVALWGAVIALAAAVWHRPDSLNFADSLGWELAAAARVVIGLGLVLPFALTACWLRERVGVATGESPPGNCFDRIGGDAAAVLIATLPSLLYVTDRAERLRIDIGDALQAQRYVQARRYVDQLIALGDNTPLDGQPPPVLKARLDRTIARLTHHVAQAVSTDSKSSLIDRIRLAQSLAQLDRFAEARVILEGDPQAASHPDALLLEGMMAQAEADFPRSDEALWAARRQSLDPDRLGDAKEWNPTPERVAELVRRSWDGLIVNATRAGDLNEAETRCRSALAELPHAATLFRYRLGLILAEKGEGSRALAELEAITPLLPASERQSAQRWITRLRQETPACLTRGWGTFVSR